MKFEKLEGLDDAFEDAPLDDEDLLDLEWLVEYGDEISEGYRAITVLGLKRIITDVKRLQKRSAILADLTYKR